MNPTFVYYLVDPRTNGVRYVGISTDPAQRFCKHLKDASLKVNGRPLHCSAWIQSLVNIGLQPIVKLICLTHREEAERIEISLISALRNKGIDLTNLTEGGDGQRKGYKWSEEARRKASISHTGKKHTAETLVKMGAAQSGRKMSDDVREKLQATWATAGSRSQNPEVRAKISAANRGLKRSELTREKMRLAQMLRMQSMSEEDKAKLAARLAAGRKLWHERNQSE